MVKTKRMDERVVTDSKVGKVITPKHPWKAVDGSIASALADIAELNWMSLVAICSWIVPNVGNLLLTAFTQITVIGVI